MVFTVLGILDYRIGPSIGSGTTRELGPIRVRFQKELVIWADSEEEDNYVDEQ